MKEARTTQEIDSEKVSVATRIYPWVSLAAVWFIILYQVSPEFQAWVNYTFRYWSRYATYSAEYAAWLSKQAWRKIPDGRR